MKRFLIITLSLMLFVGILVADNLVYTPLRHTPAQQISTATGLTADVSGSARTRRYREDDIYYIQNFEDGMEGWTTYDQTFPSAMWHLNQWNAHGGDGYSWWMADPEIGGYRNGQYTYLDTPQIMVTAENSTLTFNLNYRVEDLGNWVDPNDPTQSYNGWDGANVRISTNNGESWTVLSGTPAYNASSMFAFGRVHGEGVNVPGWGGNSNGWVNASFNLQNYIGQNVKIRFAFASDNAVDSASNPELHSVLIDNISLGAFNHNFNDGENPGMSVGSKVPTGGDLWHIGEPLPAPPSPTHAALCQNEEETYNRDMFNYIISPPIQMPAGGDISVDFMLSGSFLVNHEGNFPRCNYWGFQVSPDSGATWYAMSNPYGEPDRPNYVYVDLPENWSSAVNSFNGLDGIISDYAGEVLMFRVFFKSNDDAPVGPGMMIDDFVIYHAEYLPAPTNLTATEDGGVVHLSWNPPGIGGEEGWIHWDSGENTEGIGLSGEQGGTFDVAARFFPTDLEAYFGGYITSVKIFPRHMANTTYRLRVWTGLNGGTVARQQDIPSNQLTEGQWNEIELVEPLQISMGEHYWIGYNVAHPQGAFPAGLDGGPVVPDRGDMIRTGANWVSLNNANPQINGNWNIQAYVENMEGNRTLLSRNRVNDERSKTADRIGPDGYKIYRSTVSGDFYQHIGTIEDSEVTVYSDMNPVTGMINYYVVRAVYGNSESGPTNEAMAFVLTDTAIELAYDDGTAESGFNMGNNNHIAVRFDNDIEEMVYLTHIKAYVYERRPGAIIVKVWLVNEDGLPGTLVAQFIHPGNQVQDGWNYISMPPANPVTFTGHDFYIGFQEPLNASAIGLDESEPTGNSFTRTGSQPWAQFAHGNFMIRAILDTQLLDVDDQEVMPKVEQLTAANYPNPFNPETTIRFTLPVSGEVNLAVYNLKGQLINTLVDDVLNEGTHSFVWNGKDYNGNDIASGIYFYRLEANKQSITRRMVLLK